MPEFTQVQNSDTGDSFAVLCGTAVTSGATSHQRRVPPAHPCRSSEPPYRQAEEGETERGPGRDPAESRPPAPRCRPRSSRTRCPVGSPGPRRREGGSPHPLHQLRAPAKARVAPPTPRRARALYPGAAVPARCRPAGGEAPTITVLAEAAWGEPCWLSGVRAHSLVLTA